MRQRQSLPSHRPQRHVCAELPGNDVARLVDQAGRQIKLAAMPGDFPYRSSRSRSAHIDTVSVRPARGLYSLNSSFFLKNPKVRLVRSQVSKTDEKGDQNIPESAARGHKWTLVTFVDDDEVKELRRRSVAVS